MSCPDNLLIGYRRGALSDQDQARLESHLGGCPTCRLTLQVGSDFDQVLDTVPGDDLIAARIARNLAPKVELAGAPRGGGMRRMTWAAAAAMALIASGGLAAAMVGGAWPFERREASAPADPSSGRAVRPAQKPRAPREPRPEMAEPSTETAVVEQLAAASAPSAEELFAQANARRREGEAPRARGLYRQLQRLYPRSAEAVVSHVSLGRLQLTLDEPRDALEQFERYLGKLPRGPLSEEALFGKASALERLGRSANERRTWEALLAAYPGSVYADRARHRLEQLP